MTRLSVLVLLAFIHLMTASAALAQATPAEKVPIVGVTGCLAAEGSETWLLTNATAPEPSTAGASVKKEASVPALGKGQFRLIGVSNFDLPSLKGHMVLVKGLQIKATPIDRLNVTSVTSLAPTCGAK